MKLFSFILSEAYIVNSRNSCSDSTFLALANISRQISLKTRSTHPALASSINSLQAEYRVSFKVVLHPFFRFFFAVSKRVFEANSLRLENLYLHSLFFRLFFKFFSVLNYLSCLLPFF